MRRKVPCKHCGKDFLSNPHDLKANPFCRRTRCFRDRVRISEEEYKAARPWLEGCEWLNISTHPHWVQWAPFKNGVRIDPDTGEPVRIEPDLYEDTFFYPEATV